MQCLQYICMCVCVCEEFWILAVLVVSLVLMLAQEKRWCQELLVLLYIWRKGGGGGGGSYRTPIRPAEMASSWAMLGTL